MKKTIDFTNCITSAGVTVEPDFGRGILESEKAELSGSAVKVLVELRQDVNELITQSTNGDLTDATLFFQAFSKSRSAAVDSIQAVSALGCIDPRLTSQKTGPFTIGSGSNAIIFYQWRLLAAYDELVDDIGSGVYRANQAIEIRYNNRIGE